MKSYKKYMTGLLAAVFCWTGAVFAADNPFETAEDEIYNGRFTSEKVDLRLEQSENKETGRFFVGDLRINGISHLVLARGASGVLTGTMGEIENQADGKKEFANGASFRFMFQRQSDGKYLLQIGENEASQVLEKQTFPKLGKSYHGKGKYGLNMTFEKTGENTYNGTMRFKGENISCTNITVSAGILQGTMMFDKKHSASFTVESEKNNSLFFITGGYKDELVEEKILTVNLNDKVSLDMLWIEPGTFMMGSPTDELGRHNDETQHKVTLTQGYWLGKYEVTQAQYEAVMGTNPSEFIGADLPVEKVSWNDAKEFCAKLTASEKAAGRLPEGYEYTLPTEAQWEYACRAGTTTALNSGKNLSDEYECPEVDEVGWYYYNSKIDGIRKTHPVGQKQPNAWGLYDMHGNVWEWCLDWYGDYPTTAVTDPPGPVTGEWRVIRGGRWNYFADFCRSASRYPNHPSNYDSDIGFRVSLSIVQ